MKTALDLVAAAKAHVHEIDIDAADAAIRDADVLIDVRGADEFAAGHIPGAINVPRGVLEFKLSSTPELDARDPRVLLYCKTRCTGAMPTGALQEMGCVRVQTIAGGFDAWAAAGKPIGRPSQPAFG